MKRLIWLLLLGVCFGQGYNAYQTSTFTATGSATRVFENSTILFHQLSWTKTGTVSTCTIAVDSSPDNVTWTPGGIITGQTCTSNGSSAITSGSAVYIRVTVTVFSGGGSIAVVYKGWTLNPSGGGPPTGAAGGDLSGTYPNPNVATSTTQALSDNSTKVATTAFVQNIAAGINPAVAVQVATTAAADTSGLTYNNGVSGIGATLTGSVNTALTFDGVTLTSLNQRVLVKNDTQSPSGSKNGVYYLTQLQTGILAPILTRALDYDMPSDMNNTGAIPVISGTVNTGRLYVQSSQVTTVGTDPVTFVQFGGGGCTTGINSSGLCLLEEHTVSAAAEVDFTTCISATYDHYEITSNSLTTSATANITIQASTNGGSSYDTGSNYAWSYQYTGASAASSTSSQADTAIHMVNGVVSATTNTVDFTGYIYHPSSTTLYKKFSWHLVSTLAADKAFSTVGTGSYLVTASAMNAFRLIPSTGNITGTMRCYGLNN